MKGRHANSGPSKTHHCSRCKKHGVKMLELQKTSGRKFNLCESCARSIGKA